MEDPRTKLCPFKRMPDGGLCSGKTLFCGKDVAAALGYSNTKDALARHVDSEDKRGSRIPTPSGGGAGV